MTVRLTGRDLDRDAVLRVARTGVRVELEPAARERMVAARAIVTAAIERGDAIYGTTTGVGVLKRIPVAADEAGRYASWMLAHHVVGQGPPATDDVVRATMLRLANHFASGVPGVRPEMAERLIAALNAGELPVIRTIGSVGEGDLSPLTDLALAVFDGFELAAGEGTALLANNAFSTGWAAVAVADVATLLDALEVAAALSLEGMAANPTLLHAAIGVVRPYPGLARTIARLRELLEGSALWNPGTARNLQDPLTFRDLPQILGACRDVLAHVDAQLEIELNASQGNPIVLADEGRVVSVANFEILPLVAALDYLRIVLAAALTSAAERVIKLLGAPWSGLPTGLVPIAGTSESGLTYLSLAAQSLAVEARLLAQPVAFELVSTSHAEGIEDRTTMAPLAARRVGEMAGLGATLAAIELAVAAQAVELRGLRRGRGTGRVLVAVRAHVPYLGIGDHVSRVDGLAEAVRAGAITRAADGTDQLEADSADGASEGRADADRA